MIALLVVIVATFVCCQKSEDEKGNDGDGLSPPNMDSILSLHYSS